jgi:hypothetical protein
MALFDVYVGIDYSGAGRPEQRLPGIQVYVAHGAEAPEKVADPDSSVSRWHRRGMAEWLVRFLQSKERVIVGIDHAFSLPFGVWEKLGFKGIATWDEFLRAFRKRWPTHETAVEQALSRSPIPTIETDIERFRLTDRWTSSAKSVFQFDVQGSVAKSSFAGLPWLLHIRENTTKHRVHFWPFDGFEVATCRLVIAEVYPAILRRRFAKEGRSADEQDAYAVCAWLKERDRSDLLESYFRPPLTTEEQNQVMLEGWILGIM